MLAKPDVEVVYENGVAVGVSSEGETAKAKMVRLHPAAIGCMMSVRAFLSCTADAKLLGTAFLVRAVRA